MKKNPKQGSEEGGRNMFMVLTTKQVKTMNADAVQRDLEQALSDRGIELLDPSGLHLVVETLPLSDGTTYRHVVMLKMMGWDEPKLGFIDTAVGTRGHRAWRLGIEIEGAVAA